MKVHLKLAIVFVENRLICLSPLLLSSLFRDLKESCSGSISCGGPFWLLQIWFYAYFPEFRHTAISSFTSIPISLRLAYFLNISTNCLNNLRVYFCHSLNTSTNSMMGLFNKKIHSSFLFFKPLALHDSFYLHLLLLKITSSLSTYHVNLFFFLKIYTLARL